VTVIVDTSSTERAARYPRQHMRRLNASDRREQILEVALDVFARAGYHGASMNDIAEAVGVTKPVLYQHFDSKRDLYQALIDEVGKGLVDRIAKAVTEATDGKSQTELGFQAYFRWVAHDHDEFMLLYGSGARRDQEFADAVRKITATAAASIAPLIAVDIDESHRTTLAHALVGLAEGAGRRLVELGDQFDPDEIAVEVSALAWAGLRAVQRTN
jgi:AcrR family transcriptional regulator